jgi:two-component system response regulator EvgA
MKNVLIVDDHPVARLAVRMLLEKAGLVVVGETDDGQEAIQLTKQLSPDLVIVDIDIPSVNGIDVVERIRKNKFNGGILVLSGKDGEHYIRLCARAGADGFISKRNNLTELNDAIRAIQGGYGYFPLNRARSDAAAPTPENDDEIKISKLSPKELDVLRHLAKGIKVVEIAGLMHISDKTVSTYKSRILDKLELKNPADFFEFVRRHNLD